MVKQNVFYKQRRITCVACDMEGFTAYVFFKSIALAWTSFCSVRVFAFALVFVLWLSTVEACD